MYSVYCKKCGKGPCRMLDVYINNDEYQAVVVDDPKFAVTSVKRKGCPNIVSIGLMNVSTNSIIDPHNSVLYEKPKSGIFSA